MSRHSLVLRFARKYCEDAIKKGNKGSQYMRKQFEKSLRELRRIQNEKKTVKYIKEIEKQREKEKSAIETEKQTNEDNKKV